MTSCDVLVVGGGPAGLTAASELARSGREVVLVEASDRFGGMAASVSVSGVRVDLGSHRLHPVATPRVERLLGELLGSDLQTRQRHGRLRLADRWVQFPLRPVDLARRLPPRFLGRAIGDTLSGPVRRRRQTTEDTFAAVVRAGLGPAMLDWFYGPYAMKLWGRPAEELAGDLARRRIAANSPVRLAAKLVGAVRGGGPTFRYPRLGYGQVVERLVERGAADGADLRSGVAIERLTIGQRSAEATTPAGTIEAQFVMWTAPPDALAAAVRGVDRADGQTARVRHRAMVCAYLVYDLPRVGPYDAHYLPGATELATRVSEPTNYRDGPDPDDRTVLCAEVPCDVGDDVWTASAEVLADRLTGDLARLGLIDRPPAAVHLERLPRVYPVVTPADVEPLRRLNRWANQIPHVAAFGRQGLVVADNLHHVMAMALEAVDCLWSDGAWDHDRWGSALARFDDHVVED